MDNLFYLNLIFLNLFLRGIWKITGILANGIRIIYGRSKFKVLKKAGKVSNPWTESLAWQNPSIEPIKN